MNRYKVIYLFLVSVSALSYQETYAEDMPSSILLYGTLDAGVVHVSNALYTPSGSNKGLHGSTVFEGSLSQKSNFGIKGTEAISSDVSAIFNLEATLNLANGSLSSKETSGATVATQDIFFDRQAWVGIDSKSLGQLRLGRAYTQAYENTVFADAIAKVNKTYTSNLSYYIVGQASGATQDYRNNNQIRYDSPSWQGLSFSGHYSPGGVSGSQTQASSDGLGMRYHVDRLEFAAALQEDHDFGGSANATLPKVHENVFLWKTLAVRYQEEKFSIAALYQTTQTDNGQWETYNGSQYASATLRSTRTYGLGSTYKTSQNSELGVQFYDSHWVDHAGGNSQSLTGAWVYSLSTYTSTYIDVAKTRNHALALQVAGSLGTSVAIAQVTGIGQSLVGLGFTHRF